MQPSLEIVGYCIYFAVHVSLHSLDMDMQETYYSIGSEHTS